MAERLTGPTQPPDSRQRPATTSQASPWVDVLRPGGALVVRDHHAHDERMWRTVALAHDVFNMGTHETWEYNERERRHFYPLETLHELLTNAGLRSNGRRLLQSGDPTLNTLMLYTKA